MVLEGGHLLSGSLDFKEPPRVLHISCDDWEVLYIDGKAVKQGHSLTRPDPYFWLYASEKYGFSYADIKFAKENSYLSEMLYEKGCFPEEFPRKEMWARTLEYCD
jgi:hypothetical protein